MDSPRNFTPRAIIRICGQLLNALAYLHQNNVVHGCITPSCIFISNDMGVKLSNLGGHPKVPDMETTAQNNDVQYSSPEDIALWLPTSNPPPEWRDKIRSVVVNVF